MGRQLTRSACVMAGLVYLWACVCGVRADDWPQWRGAGRDGVWKETGIVEKLPDGQIPLKWRAPIGGGYSGPTVAGQRVYVTDRLTEPKSVERVLCFDRKTGKRLWVHPYDCPYGRQSYPTGPRAAVSVDDGRAYALGTTGRLHCLDAATGKPIWRKDLKAEYRIRVPIWGIAAAPLVDGEKVILLIGGADGACVVALDKKTGEQKWRALDDRASYSAPIIVRQAGRRVLVCWTGDNVAGLDPETGKLHWKHALKPAKMVLNVPTPILSGERLFVTGFYDGSLMLRLHATELRVKKLWRIRGPSEHDTVALHSMMSTPVMLGEHIYGVDSYGELRCLEAATGRRVWEDRTAVPRARWSNIHMVRNGDRIWMFNERGELIICRLTPKGFDEISRAKLIEPTTGQLRQRGGVCWSHPAYAHKHIFARNDKQLVCADLAAD